jgi:restriction system protein
VTQVWLIRAGRADELEGPALADGLVLLRRSRVGDLTGAHTLPAIRALVDRAYPEFSVKSRQVFAGQLLAFRDRVQPGDFAVLLRENAPTVAIGTVTGGYTYRADLPGSHVRSVHWLRASVGRSEIGPELLRAPALTDIFKVNNGDLAGRLATVTTVTQPTSPAHSTRPAPVGGAGEPVPGIAPAGPPTPTRLVAGAALANLRRNLDYALSLATAGLHLQLLKVEAFEVADVFRAAWVQAVAALDHWVHQEIRERLLLGTRQLAPDQGAALANFGVSKKLVAQATAGSLTVQQAIEEHLKNLGGASFQKPHMISSGLCAVTGKVDLWPEVARVLTERAGDGATVTADEIEDRLRSIADRRNKIAHESDEDPAAPPAKRAIDAATTTQSVEWIGQLAEAILVVLGKPGSPAAPNSPAAQSLSSPSRR